MDLRLPALATAVLLASGCAISEPPLSTASPSTRTRAEVHAEAVAAAKNHKSTLEEELEYFTH